MFGGLIDQELLKEILVRFVRFAYDSSVIWLPAVMVSLLLKQWLDYIRRRWSVKEGNLLLEIKLPKEIKKTPAAMELFFIAMHQAASTNYSETFWDGKVRPWFSLELASEEGEVHFYIWTLKRWRDLIESQIYAQYPTVEIYEVPDYTIPHVYDPAKHVLWGTYFKLSKADAFPIRTYIDYEMQKDAGKEADETLDPMSSVVEYLGSMKKGERAWIQIIIQAHRELTFEKDGIIFGKPDWKKDIDVEIKKIMDSTKPDKDADFKMPRALTKSETETIESLERSKSKFPFEVGIRAMYFANKESVNPVHISGLIGTFRQYSSNSGNGFKMGFFTDFDYPWQDFLGLRLDYYKRLFLDAYKHRSFFQPPYKFWKGEYSILTTEELATIFHFPGGVVSTPTVVRVGSRKSEAPKNLPV